MLFDGCEQRRIARHNVIELQGESYLIAGRVIALSLMYGGPAPQFFARPVAEYLLGITAYTVSIEDVPDQCIQKSLLQVLITHNIWGSYNVPLAWCILCGQFKGLPGYTMLL